jgi:hypothetical protein
MATVKEKHDKAAADKAEAADKAAADKADAKETAKEAKAAKGSLDYAAEIGKIAAAVQTLTTAGVGGGAAGELAVRVWEQC